ncbi:unnamed protein product [Gadus morhua 'NCC']
MHTPLYQSLTQARAPARAQVQGPDQLRGLPPVSDKLTLVPDPDPGPSPRPWSQTLVPVPDPGPGGGGCPHRAERRCLVRKDTSSHVDLSPEPGGPGLIVFGYHDNLVNAVPSKTLERSPARLTDVAAVDQRPEDPDLLQALPFGQQSSMGMLSAVPGFLQSACFLLKMGRTPSILFLVSTSRSSHVFSESHRRAEGDGPLWTGW